MSEKLTTSTSETKDGDSSSSETSVSKKKSTAVSTLGGLTAERVLKPEPAAKPERPAESLWDRMERITSEFKQDISGDKPAADKPEGPLSAFRQDEFGPRPAAETAGKLVEITTDADNKEAIPTVTVPAEALSADEAAESVRMYADARLAALAEEIATPAEDDTEGAATAANIAFLRAMQDKMATESEPDIPGALDAAERETLTVIHPEYIPEPQAGTEQGPQLAEDAEQPSSMPLIPGQRQPAHDAMPDAAPPVSEMPLAGGGDGLPPDIWDKMYGGGSDGPEGPGDADAAGSAGRESIAVPSGGPSLAEAVPAGMITTAALLGRERAAMGQGVLVGGIAGYFAGKRRGRKQTEKKLRPLQQKLEKQVSALYGTVAAKEQKIRSQAAEIARMSAVRPAVGMPSAERQTATAAEQSTVAAARPEQVNAKRTAAGFERRQTAEAAERAVPRPERLGRFIVEAPLAGALLAGAAAERAVAGSPVAAAAAERPAGGRAGAESAAPLPPVEALLKNKSVENLSTAELKHAAEKVRIEGVSLRELLDSRRLDERGARRVMVEYLRGGNVGEVLSRELMEKELQYERDPRMKAAAGGAIAGGGGMAITAALFGAQAADNTDPKNGSTADAGSSQSPKRPVPDAATLEALKRQQARALAGGTGLLLLGLLVLVLLLA